MILIINIMGYTPKLILLQNVAVSSSSIWLPTSQTFWHLAQNTVKILLPQNNANYI